MKLRLTKAEKVAFDLMIKMPKIMIINYYFNESRARERAFRFIAMRGHSQEFDKFLK